MDIAGLMRRLGIFVFLPILSLAFACSTPSWFPLKKSKGPVYKANSKELVDKEVVIIDKEEYVKVFNPKASEGGAQPKYLYIPVNEYLAKRETFSVPTARQPAPKKETSVSVNTPKDEKEGLTASSSVLSSPTLKRKAVVIHFDDRTTQPEEVFGDWIAENLVKEVDRRSQGVIFVDYQMVKEFLEKRSIPLADLETPKVLQLLNEVFGVHALIFGTLTGPYAFTTKGMKDQEMTASAIIKIEIRVIDTFSGKVLKNLSAVNPITSTKATGSFPEERAKVKAIDVTLADLSRSLAREIEGLDWFCRIAKVEGEEVYLNAGRLSGIKVGDEMEIFRPQGSGERREVKGKIRISTLFGVDASMGRLINGKKPDLDDILRLAKREGA